MLYPTKDCKKIVVAVEAEPYESEGTTIDHEGGVALIKFQGTPAENYDLKLLNFSNFNDQ